MSAVIVDLTNFKDTSSARVEPGQYNVVVEDADLTKSKAGNPMIVMTLRILGGESDGLTLIDRLTITEAAMFRVVAFLQALGIPTPKKRLKLNTQSLIGKKLTVEVDDGEPYKGRVKSEIQDYMRLTGKAAGSSNDDDVADLGDVEDVEEDVNEADTVDESDAENVAETAKTADDEVSSGEIEPEEVDLDSIDLG